MSQVPDTVSKLTIKSHGYEITLTPNSVIFERVTPGWAHRELPMSVVIPPDRLAKILTVLEKVNA